MRFKLSSERLPTQLLIPSDLSGAVVSFCGLVRRENEGRQVISLEYESYPELATKEGERILDEALTRFAVDDSACTHRVGHLRLGEVAILVEVAAGHRAEAFDACHWIVDQIKARVPIWKKEYYEDGETEWLDPGGGHQNF